MLCVTTTHERTNAQQIDTLDLQVVLRFETCTLHQVSPPGCDSEHINYVEGPCVPSSIVRRLQGFC